MGYICAFPFAHAQSRLNTIFLTVKNYDLAAGIGAIKAIKKENQKKATKATLKIVLLLSDKVGI